MKEIYTPKTLWPNARRIELKVQRCEQADLLLIIPAEISDISNILSIKAEIFARSTYGMDRIREHIENTLDASKICVQGDVKGGGIT